MQEKTNTVETSKMSPIIVALDVDTQAMALELAKQLDPQLCRVKVGKELFTNCGPAVVEALQSLGFEVFLDLKFHDIPNTVAKALKSVTRLGVWMVNVHAMGGEKMLLQAADAIQGSAVAFERRPLLTAVTLLTSLTPKCLPAVGLQGLPEKNVLRLATLVHECGLDGIVCSAEELPALRREITDIHFVYVTPGIRPVGFEAQDQSRIVTPIEAVRAGSDYLVIGRPITQSSSPVRTLEHIITSLNGTEGADMR